MPGHRTAPLVRWSGGGGLWGTGLLPAGLGWIVSSVSRPRRDGASMGNLIYAVRSRSRSLPLCLPFLRAAFPFICRDNRLQHNHAYSFWNTALCVLCLLSLSLHEVPKCDSMTGAFSRSRRVSLPVLLVRLVNNAVPIWSTYLPMTSGEVGVSGDRVFGQANGNQTS